MRKLIKSIFSPPSLRVSIIVIVGVVLLLFVSLSVMFYFSHKAIHEETTLSVEKTLESTVLHVDNILFSVEQSTGNIYQELEEHLDQPERMNTYCRRLVESNPNIVGCAICFKPNYYAGRELFMTYVHHKGGNAKKNVSAPLVTTNSFGSKPYTEYEWYSVPMSTKQVCWTDPLPEEEDEGVTLSFCLPIFDKTHEPVGVIAVDLSIELLSWLVLSDKSTSDLYSVMLASDGSFIMHPDKNKLTFRTVLQKEYSTNQDIQDIAKAMLAGKTGNMSFQLNGNDFRIFYRPFLQTKMPGRSMKKLNWSIGVVYAEKDVFGSFYNLLLLVLIIGIVGLLVLFFLTRLVMHRLMIPFLQLKEVVQRISKGHYDAPMPVIKRNDEIGQLSEHFELMKNSLVTHVNELNQMMKTLKNRREVTHEVFAKEKSVDRVMTSLLHYGTNQMIAPADDIERYSKTLCSNYYELSPEEINQVVGAINKKSDTIIEQVNQLLNTADNDYE